MTTVLYTKRAAAKIAGTTPYVIDQEIRAGRIKIIKVGAREKISEGDLKKLMISNNKDSKITYIIDRLKESGYSADQTLQIVSILDGVI